MLSSRLGIGAGMTPDEGRRRLDPATFALRVEVDLEVIARPLTSATGGRDEMRLNLRN